MRTCRICGAVLRNKWIGPTPEGSFYCPVPEWQACENRSVDK